MCMDIAHRVGLVEDSNFPDIDWVSHNVKMLDGVKLLNDYKKTSFINIWRDYKRGHIIGPPLRERERASG